jgi:hypothetical protein
MKKNATKIDDQRQKMRDGYSTDAKYIVTLSGEEGYGIVYYDKTNQMWVKDESNQTNALKLLRKAEHQNNDMRICLLFDSDDLIHELTNIDILKEVCTREYQSLEKLTEIEESRFYNVLYHRREDNMYLLISFYVSPHDKADIVSCALKREDIKNVIALGHNELLFVEERHRNIYDLVDFISQKTGIDFNTWLFNTTLFYFEVTRRLYGKNIINDTIEFNGLKLIIERGICEWIISPFDGVELKHVKCKDKQKSMLEVMSDLLQNIDSIVDNDYQQHKKNATDLKKLLVENSKE